MTNVKTTIVEDFLNKFANNLEKTIKDSGLTFYGLASKLGLDGKVIFNIVKNKADPKFSTVIRLAKGLDISLDSLTGLSGSNNCLAVAQKDIDSKKVELPSALPQHIYERKDVVNLAARCMSIHENDIEILLDIANVLDVCRERRFTRIVKAVDRVKKKRKKEQLTTSYDEEAEEIDENAIAILSED